MTTNIPATGPVACEICLKQIPRSAAESEEAADYVYYFCGGDCYQQWQQEPPMHHLGLIISGLGLDFESAQALAKTAASRLAPGAMLLAWYDRPRGRESPEVPECTSKPGWIAYAEGHGGDIRVDVNHGEYVFMFAAG
ncbi:MAG: AF1514 family protein [Betaproteobacteria bacterium]|nr:AF1514 family protein [Betaproteobacteria bacterium]